MLVKHLPPTSATAQAANNLQGFGVTDLLLADVFHALTGKAHPARPTGKGGGSKYREKRAALEAQRARLKAERAATT